MTPPYYGIMFLLDDAECEWRQARGCPSRRHIIITLDHITFMFWTERALYHPPFLGTNLSLEKSEA